MIKFVLDVGVGKKVESYLRDAGYEVISILDENPSMKDNDILIIAVRENAMVVTMDKDFGELVFREQQFHSGVLLLRLEDATGEEKAAVVKHILENYEAEINGNFCVFQNGKLRIRQSS